MIFNSKKKLCSALLSMMLIVAVASTTGCAKEDFTQSSQVSGVQVERTTVGNGEKMFLFDVVDDAGNTSAFEVHTDKTTVGEALIELNLISGDNGDFGLYVKTVNGITADYDVNKTYWAFYVNGEYATSGVDSTTIEEGATYLFKVEK